MPHAKYSAEEIAERGEALYGERIARQLSQADHGRFLVIDIETGEYEVDDDDLPATERMLAKRPAAVTYGLRIGYATAYRLGAGSAGRRR
ncbi:MAG: hypothetical protein ACRDJ9_05870 [Dehalococcoidia bacterium]